MEVWNLFRIKYGLEESTLIEIGVETYSSNDQCQDRILKSTVKAIAYER